MRKQQQASYSNSNISGPFVLYMQGSGENNGVMGPVSQVFQGTGDAAGHLSINASYSDKSGSYSPACCNRGPTAVTIGTNGRSTLVPGNGTAYLYLFGTNNAMILSVEGDGGFSSGWVEPQQPPASSAPYGFAYIKGAYMMGGSPMQPSQNGNVGEVALDSSGNLTGGMSGGGENGFSYDQALSMTYTWDSTAYGTFLIGTPSSNGSKGGLSCIDINAQKFACTLQGDDAPSVFLFQQ
jgi:hypothetical protein